MEEVSYSQILDDLVLVIDSMAKALGISFNAVLELIRLNEEDKNIENQLSSPSEN